MRHGVNANNFYRCVLTILQFSGLSDKINKKYVHLAVQQKIPKMKGPVS
jgi:hypothetical protein